VPFTSTLGYLAIRGIRRVVPGHGARTHAARPRSGVCQVHERQLRRTPPDGNSALLWPQRPLPIYRRRRIANYPSAVTAVRGGIYEAAIGERRLRVESRRARFELAEN